MDEQLGYEIARYAFGPAAERRRRAWRTIPRSGEAVELVRGTTSPQALLGLAEPGRAAGSLIHHPHARRHLELEGVVGDLPIHPQLRQRQRPQWRRSSR